VQIGFLGLGNMGGPMAANLAKAGHDVFGFDVAGVAVEGVNAVATAVEAAKDRDAVITMLPNGQILTAVYDEIVPVGRVGGLFIDCSTVDVASALSAHARAQKRGIATIDAPVSGGIAGAAAGTLTFMAGGAPEAFARAKPLLDVMGQKTVHCGSAGSGQSAKICNNMVLGISMIAVCEAFALADKLGLERQSLFDVMSTSSGSCWAVNNYCPAPGIGPKSPADNGYRPGFSAELMLKDLRLSQAAAEGSNAPTPLGQRATELYDRFVESGGLGKDFSALLPWFSSVDRGVLK